MENSEITQGEAVQKAIKIAKQVNGDGLEEGWAVWNDGWWPTSSPDVINIESGKTLEQRVKIISVENFDDLKGYVEEYPVYAYYNNEPQDEDKKIAAHLIVVTGIASAPGHPKIVTTNNPWGDSNVQTFDEFLGGIPGDGKGMRFKGILRSN